MAPETLDQTVQSTTADATPDAEARPVPIVAIGASAGGLEAATELLKGMPPDSGLAFVLIQHLDPSHPSQLTEVLQRSTSLPTHEIADGMTPEANHVYVIPSNADVGFKDGRFTLQRRATEPKRLHLPIDRFFQAIALDKKDRAIGVVLSGTGEDGSEGLKAIHAEGGITLVQDPSTAKHAGMPDAAIRTGVIDLVLPAPGLAQELLRIGRHPYLEREPKEADPRTDEETMHRILALVRRATGVDFGEYKSQSLGRRLARRMALQRIDAMGDYAGRLANDTKEAHALCEDFLIHVTSFFRDPEVFERLKERVFPEILAAKQTDAGIRIWVPGCATGQEVYSLLIVLLEFLGEKGALHTPIQVFGTDLSEKALDTARAGLYSDAAIRGMGADRLQRFFTKVDGGGYRIAKSVRERCAFVRHDVGRDPPFSKLDLVSCRNLLIYMAPELQKRVIATLQFSLSQPGFLLLGRSENVAAASNLFTPVHPDMQIFGRTTARSTFQFAHPAPSLGSGVSPGSTAQAPADVVQLAANVILDTLAPCGVIVNDRMEILHFRGRTAPYLEPTPGQPQHHLLRMAKRGLVAELGLALSQARDGATPVRRSGVRIDPDRSEDTCDLLVIPVGRPTGSPEHLYMVLFEDASPDSATAREHHPLGPVHLESEESVRRLADELVATKAYLQSVLDARYQANDDLTVANQELTSGNEELQSLNEELGTAKEELQSTNEELSTLNQELHTRNDELDSVNGDLVNILASVEVPIVIVDAERRIRRFTPKARPILNLLSSDIGRPIDDLRPNLVLKDLDKKIAAVVATQVIHEEETTDPEGRWYRLQIRPYTTVDKRADGAVLSIVDVDVLKRALATAEIARDSATATLGATSTPLLVLDEKLVILSANASLYEQFGLKRDETQGKGLCEVLGGALDGPELKDKLAELIETDAPVRSLAVTMRVRDRGNRSFQASSRTIPAPNGRRMILLELDDVTDRMSGESIQAGLLVEAQAAKIDAEHANMAKDTFLATLSHELRTPLSSLLLQAQLLRRGPMDPERLARAAQAIERATKAQAQLVDDLLDISRIVAGKMQLELRAVALEPIVTAALDSVRPLADQKALSIELEANAAATVSGDPGRLQQVVLNLLTNAIKFTPEYGHVTVTVDTIGRSGRIVVKDDGIGIAPEFLPLIFHRFTQEPGRQARTHAGLGLGLAIVHHLVEAHMGTVSADSAGKDQGTTFTVLLPLVDADRVPTSADPVGSSADAPSRSLKGLRVLVVDDDPDTLNALAEMLGSAGVLVDTALSAREAMVRFDTRRPDLLISDVSMPEEGGYGLIGRIRARGPARGGDVPALALTALAQEADRASALRAGFDAHVAKPIAINGLVAAMARVLGLRAEFADYEPYPTFLTH